MLAVLLAPVTGGTVEAFGTAPTISGRARVAVDENDAHHGPFTERKLDAGLRAGHGLHHADVFRRFGVLRVRGVFAIADFIAALVVDERIVRAVCLDDRQLDSREFRRQVRFLRGEIRREPGRERLEGIGVIRPFAGVAARKNHFLKHVRGIELAARVFGDGEFQPCPEAAAIGTSGYGNLPRNIAVGLHFRGPVPFLHVFEIVRCIVKNRAADAALDFFTAYEVCPGRFRIVILEHHFARRGLLAPRDIVHRLASAGIVLLGHAGASAEKKFPLPFDRRKRRGLVGDDKPFGAAARSDL